LTAGVCEADVVEVVGVAGWGGMVLYRTGCAAGPEAGSAEDEVVLLSPTPAPGVLRWSLKSESRVDMDLWSASVIGLGAWSMSGMVVLFSPVLPAELPLNMER
jgi:hypothetical protein